jgi:hypothetical protein
MFLLGGLQKPKETHCIGCCQLKVDIFSGALRATFLAHFYHFAANEGVLAGCLSDNLRRISRYFKGGFHGAVSSLCNWRMPTRSTRQRRFIRPASFRGVSLERRDSMSTNLGRGSEESNHGMPRADSGRPVDSFSWVGLPT